MYLSQQDRKKSHAHVWCWKQRVQGHRGSKGLTARPSFPSPSARPLTAATYDDPKESGEREASIDDGIVTRKPWTMSYELYRDVRMYSIKLQTFSSLHLLSCSSSLCVSTISALWFSSNCLWEWDNKSQCSYALTLHMNNQWTVFPAKA